MIGRLPTPRALETYDNATKCPINLAYEYELSVYTSGLSEKIITDAAYIEKYFDIAMGSLTIAINLY